MPDRGDYSAADVLAADVLVADRRRLHGLGAVMVSAVAVGLTVGMTIPLVALSMEAAGAGAWLIGVNAAMPAVAVLVTAPLVPRLVCAIGMVPAAVVGCLVSALALALFPVLGSVPAWFVLRFAVGFGLAVQWVVNETWLCRAANSSSRGRLVGLYATMWCGGIAVGPLLLQFTGIDGVLPFVVAAVLILLATLPPMLARYSLPPLPPLPPCPASGGQFSVLVWSEVFFAAPAAVFAGFTTGFVEISLFTLLPLYTGAAGVERPLALLTVSVLAVGGLVCQVPLGWLADRVGSSRVLRFAAGFSLAAVVGLDLVLGATAGVEWGLWPLLFLWGGAISAFYTLGLIEIAHKFPPERLAHANVMFIMVYTIGTIAGPAVSGALLDMWPGHGLPVVLALVFGLYLVAGAIRWNGPTAP
ncbi:MAG: MFS transporter [Rhodospirillaceae bacterium]